ncbi:hypothetical protein QTP86_007352 [Hemibagrus guttatus]|nr:hypothetical protein QTP86_007352 [Hemibagrus guttatus]
MGKWKDLSAFDKGKIVMARLDQSISKIAALVGFSQSAVGDKGGERVLQKKWTTFLKAQLLCSLPGDGFPFNIIQDVFVLTPSKEDWKSTVFYGVFTSQCFNKPHMDSTPSVSGVVLQNTSHLMNPAELQAALILQGAMIHAYQDQVTTLQAENTQLHQQSQVHATLPSPTPIMPPPSCELLKMSLPDKFNGTADHCRVFVRQCEIFFTHQPILYVADITRCAFMLSLLTGRALDWASAIWDSDPQIQSSLSYFMELLCDVFEYPTGGKGTSVQLLELWQGVDIVADYVIKFHTLAAQSGWNDTALLAVF